MKQFCHYSILFLFFQLIPFTSLASGEQKTSFRDLSKEEAKLLYEKELRRIEPSSEDRKEEEEEEEEEEKDKKIKKLIEQYARETLHYHQSILRVSLHRLSRLLYKEYCDSKGKETLKREIPPFTIPSCCKSSDSR